MRLILFITFAMCLMLLPPPFEASAQTGWCGYALIEGLPIAKNQIGIFELITPPRTRESQPDELLQVRYSLDNSKVLIEGCFKVLPSRELVNYLLTIVGIDPATVSRSTVSLFAPNDSREIGAASVRFYLQQNVRDWEVPVDSPDEVTK